MWFWIGLAVLGFVVTVLIVESAPVRRRLERRGSSDAGGFWAGGWTGGDGGGWGGDGGCGGGDGGGGGGG